MKLKYLVPVLALAATNVAAEINFNGFATIAGGLTMDDDQALDGYIDEFNFDNDSLFGLQASADLDDGLSFTGQFVARGNSDWNVDVEWAYLNYELNENVRFTAGKQRIPLYMYTEFLDVGYAYHWITPPRGVYDLPVESATAISAIFSGSAGNFNNDLQIFLGRSEDDALLDGEELESDLKDLISVAWTMNYDWFTLRLGHTSADTTLVINDPVFNTVIAGWSQPTTEVFGVADKLLIEETPTTFSEIGLSFDFENLQIIAEYAKLEQDDAFTADQESYYVSFAYRFTDVVLHGTYGVDEDKNDFSALAGVPAGVDPNLDALVAGTGLLLASREEDSSHWTLGMRWDFHPSAAFKVEYTDFSDDLFLGDAQLLRLAVSTVF